MAQTRAALKERDNRSLRQLTSEGGRTSRGSMGLMKAYVQFLNEWAEKETINLTEVENYWAEEVRQFFNNRPFTLSADTSKTIRANLDDLFEQARKREQENKGSRYLGIMLQHLVAAKLQLILPEASFEIHGASCEYSVNVFAALISNVEKLSPTDVDISYRDFPGIGDAVAESVATQMESVKYPALLKY